jgi:hypothetical protein
MLSLRLSLDVGWYCGRPCCDEAQEVYIRAGCRGFRRTSAASEQQTTASSPRATSFSYTTSLSSINHQHAPPSAQEHCSSACHCNSSPLLLRCPSTAHHVISSPQSHWSRYRQLGSGCQGFPQGQERICEFTFDALLSRSRHFLTDVS